jgi:hypothetical protein
MLYLSCGFYLNENVNNNLLFGIPVLVDIHMTCSKIEDIVLLTMLEMPEQR